MITANSISDSNKNKIITNSENDNKYKMLMNNVRNFEILSNEEFEYIKSLSKEQLLEIINIYNLHNKFIKPILNEL